MIGLSCRAAFVAIAAPHLEAATEFYIRLLKRLPDPHIPAVYAEFQLPGLRLSLFKPKQSHAEEFAARSSGSMSLCLEVENLGEAIEHLRAIGSLPIGEIMTTEHGQEVYTFDPLGNRLILHQSLPQFA